MLKKKKFLNQNNLKSYINVESFDINYTLRNEHKMHVKVKKYTPCPTKMYTIFDRNFSYERARKMGQSVK